MLYDVVRILHSLNRWAVVVLLVVVVVRGAQGWRHGSAWTPLDRRLGRLAVGAVDLQMLLGLLLYLVLSPYTRAAFGDLGAAMADSTLRFWLVEHGPVMLLAVVLVHVGNARAGRGQRHDADDPGHAAAPVPGRPPWVAHRAAAVWFGLATVVVLAAIPWPFMAYGRPLLPGL